MKRRRNYIRIAAILALLPAAVGVGFAAVLGTGTTDYQGGLLIPANGDVLNGVFYNVGEFRVNSGVTVYVAVNTKLEVYAATITVNGILNGTGSGSPGGFGGSQINAGGPGQGVGFGDGGTASNGVNGFGGCGAGYAGLGGHGGYMTSSGTAYGYTAVASSSYPPSSDDVELGSGGGGGCGSGGSSNGGGTSFGGDGGAGGAGVLLEASSVTVNGIVYVSGKNGYAANGNSGDEYMSGGGAGSGGTILIRALNAFSGTGLIDAKGGNGGVSNSSGGNSGGSGGAGSGGRIKLFYNNYSFLGSSSIANGTSVGGGQRRGGDGASGTVYSAIISSPVTSASNSAIYQTSINWSWAMSSGGWGSATDSNHYKFRVYSSTVTPSTYNQYQYIAEVSSSTLQFSETGLLPNTTYSRYVVSYTDWGNSLALRTTDTCTVIETPLNISFTTYASSITASIATPTNLTNGLSGVRISISSPIASPYVQYVSTSITGLTPNTTYQFFVQTRNAVGVENGVAGPFYKCTLALPPDTTSYSSVLVSTLTVNFGHSSNQAGTPYQVDIDTNSGFDAGDTIISSNTAGNNATFYGLTGNTTYYARVCSLSFGGDPSAFVLLGATVTAANPPTFSGFTYVSTGSITLTTNTNANAADTLYTVVCATNAVFAPALSTTTAAQSIFNFTDKIQPNTTYWFQAMLTDRQGKPSQWVSFGSTVTLAVAPLEKYLYATSTGSLLLSFTTGFNPADTEYLVAANTQYFSPSGALVSTPAWGAVPNGIISAHDLTPNTIYAVTVRARNRAGTQTAVTVSSSACTYAVAPSTASVDVTSNGLYLSWQAIGNPDGTLYDVLSSSVSANDSFAKDSDWKPMSGNIYPLPGPFTPNVTYYFTVMAKNQDNILTSSITIHTSTLPSTPGAPAATVIGCSSITVNSNGADDNIAGTQYSYQIYATGWENIDANGLQSANPVWLVKGASITIQGLTPNTSYRFKVMSQNASGVNSPYSAEASTYTLAAVPTLSFAGVYSTIISLNIGANNNPASTSYEIQSSTNSNFITLSSAAITSGTIQLNGFTMYTTYYFRARAVPDVNPPSGWSAAISSVTTGIDSVVVSGPQYANANGITWTWPQSSAADLINYNVQVWEKGGAAPLKSANAGTSASYSYTAVTDKTTYYCSVQVNKTGGVSAWANSGYTLVDTGAPDPVSQITPSNGQTFSDNVTFTWPAATDSESPIASYWLQVVTPQSGTALSAATASKKDISSNLVAVFDAEVGNVLTKQITGLESGKVYYARVKSKDSAGNWGNYSGWSNGVTVWSAAVASAKLIDKAIVAPNPVNPDDPITERRSASVLFYMPSAATVKIKIYTLTGRLVLEKSIDITPVGNCGTWLWDCKNGDGARVAPGGYICVLDGHREKSERLKIAVWY